MATAVHVNGEALVRISTTSTGLLTSTGGLNDLGVSVDGVDIELRDYTEPVIADTTGPSVPFDEQQFLEDGLIRCQVVVYDETVLGTIRGRAAIAQSQVEGQIGAAGFLWGANAMYFRLLVTSPTDSVPWNFPKARLRASFPVKIGTRRSLWNLEFLALPAVNNATIATAYIGTTGSTSGRVLYNRVTT